MTVEQSPSNIPSATTGAVPSLDQPMRIRGVISDLNGTLDDIERLRNRLWPVACSLLGYPGHYSEEFLPTLGATSEEVIDIVAQVVFRESSLPFDEARTIVRGIREERNRLVAANLPEHPEARADWLRREGAEELLRFLEDREVPVAIATASKRGEAEPILRLTRLDSLVTPELVVTACDLPKENRSKTSIVREAQQRLGIPAQQCIGLEDSEKGILSMAEVGCVPVFVEGLKPLGPEAYSKTAQSHRNLLTTKAWLASLEFDSSERCFFLPPG